MQSDWLCSFDGAYLNLHDITEDESTLIFRCTYCFGIVLLNLQNQLKCVDRPHQRIILSKLNQKRKERESKLHLEKIIEDNEIRGM